MFLQACKYSVVEQNLEYSNKIYMFKLFIYYISKMILLIFFYYKLGTNQVCHSYLVWLLFKLTTTGHWCDILEHYQLCHWDVQNDS